MTHNPRSVAEEHEHTYEHDAVQSEAWRRVLSGDLGQLKYFRAILARILVSRAAADASGLDASGLETRMLDLRGRDETVDAVVGRHSYDRYSGPACSTASETRW